MNLFEDLGMRDDDPEVIAARAQAAEDYARADFLNETLAAIENEHCAQCGAGLHAMAGLDGTPPYVWCPECWWEPQGG